MLFTEARFLAFFAAVFGLFWLLRGNGARKLLLLVASYVFYGAWDWRFLFLMFGSTLLDYAVGVWLSRTDSPRWRRVALAASLAGNLGSLALFKYYDFFVTSCGELLSWLGFEVSPRTLGLVLPVGISFYTFQTLSYAIDVYRRQLAPVVSFLDFALFVSFFPQLVAGPIVRAADFLPQLRERTRFQDVAVRSCLVLFLIGYVKKACVSDHAAFAVDPVFADPALYGPGSLLLAALLYAMQIYCDFSGYSDMALATAGLFGYRLALNFDFPYFATSVTRFWRRWHVSLSTWFRDYLYVPLGGNRGSPARTYFNLFTVFLLCGLWHGARWNFVIWGLLHGVFLILERRLAPQFGREPPVLLGRLYTLAVVVLAWVVFRSETLAGAVEYLERLFGAGRPATASLSPWWWLLLSAFIGGHLLAYRRTLARIPAALPDFAFAFLYGAAAALALPFAAAEYRPFIYFQF